MARGNHDADKFTRESFTFRRMKPWQIWGIMIFVVLLGAAAIIWL